MVISLDLQLESCGVYWQLVTPSLVLTLDKRCLLLTILPILRSDLTLLHAPSNDLQFPGCNTLRISRAKVTCDCKVRAGPFTLKVVGGGYDIVTAESTLVSTHLP